MKSVDPSFDSWQIASGHQQLVDPLLDSLVLLSRYYGSPCSEDSLTSGLPLVDSRLTVDLFPRAAERAGLSARLANQPLDRIPPQLLPCLLLLKDHRCCLLMEVEEGRAKILQPESKGGEDWIELDALSDLYIGHLFYVKQKYRFDERAPEVLDTKRGHWFWSTVRESLPIYRDVLIASVLINLFAAATPLFVMNVYDRVVPNLAFESLWVLSAGVAIVFVFDFILKQLRSYFIDIAGKKIDLQVSARIFSRVMGMRLEARPPSVGAFANHLQSFENVREFITSATVGSLVDMPFALLILLVIWLIGGPLVVIPLTAAIAMLLYSLYIQRPLAASIEAAAQHGAQKNALLVESLAGMETVKLAGAEGWVQSQWEKAVAEIGQCEIKSRKTSNSVASLSSYLQQMSTVATVVYGVYLVAAGDISMGGIIAAVMLGSRAVAPMAQLSLLSTRYNQAKASMTIMEQIMSIPGEQEQGKKYIHRQELEGLIEFDQVGFNYPNSETQVLNSVSFTIKPGERVAIIGRIGAGKSTVARLLSGLYQPTRGDVRIDGISLGQIHPADLRRNLGCVTQDNQLFYGSIRDNITLGAPYVDDETVLKAVHYSGVNQFTDIDPQGIERPVGEGGRFLSGGQRQLVALARAVLLRPNILLYDEPSSHLDSRAEQFLLNNLKTLHPDRTLVLVTHKTTMLDAVDRIIVMERGRVVADGPKSLVLSRLKDGKVRTTGQPRGGDRGQ